MYAVRSDLLLHAWWHCRNRSSGWAATARPPPRPAGGSSTNPAGWGAEVAPMPRPAREIGGTTAARPAERRRSCSVAGLVVPKLQAVWPTDQAHLDWCQCCGCMDCSSGTAAMRCDFKSQQLRALSNWSATNLWLALARLAGFDAFVRVETCVAAAVGFDARIRGGILLNFFPKKGIFVGQSQRESEPEFFSRGKATLLAQVCSRRGS